MILRCTTCSTPFRPDDVTMVTGLARCRVCDIVVTVTPGPSPRPEVVRPEMMTVEEKAKSIRISWPVATGFFRFFALGMFLLLLGISGIVLSILFISPAIWMHEAPPVFFVLLILAFPTILTLGLAINDVVLELNPEELAAFYAPIPGMGFRRSFNPASVAQLYCRSSTARNGSQMFEVAALMTDGNVFCIASDLPDTRSALFIEQQLERHLGIEDRIVNGELPRL